MSNTIKRHLLNSAVILSVTLVSHVTHAQTIPGPAAADRAADLVSPLYLDDDNNTQINIPELRVEGAPQGAETILFTLNGIQIEGVTAIAPDDLAVIYTDAVGTEVTLAEVYGMAREITRYYRSQGYLISQAVIPQQTIDDGIVTIRMVEGFISGITVQGGENTLMGDRVRALANDLMQTQPLTVKSMERQLLLINDMAGLSARTIIGPSATVIGGADATIILSEDPFAFSISVDNLGSRYLGPIQFSAAAQSNNLFNAGEKINLQFATAPEDQELKYAFGSITLPINSMGTELIIDASHADTEPGFDLEILAVNGYATGLGLELKHPILRSREENLFGSLRFDIGKSATKSEVDVTRTDRNRAVTFGLQYDKIDTLWNIAANNASIQFKQGVDLFNASDAGDPQMTRDNGEPQFFKIEAEAQRLQKISNDFSFLLGVKGQWSADPLLSADEFGIGGRDYGRGYDPSEITGDDGIAAKVELRWQEPVSIPDAHIPYELYGFYDVGRVWNQSETSSALKRNSIASAGLGVRMDLTNSLDFEGYVAIPLTREVDTRDQENRRAFFRLTQSF